MRKIKPVGVRAFAIALAIAVVATVAFAGGNRDDDRDHVFVCHHENHRSAYSISCRRNEVPWHLAHGDEVGSCHASPHR